MHRVWWRCAVRGRVVRGLVCGVWRVRCAGRVVRVWCACCPVCGAQRAGRVVGCRVGGVCAMRMRCAVCGLSLSDAHKRAPGVRDRSLCAGSAPSPSTPDMTMVVVGGRRRPQIVGRSAEPYAHARPTMDELAVVPWSWLLMRAGARPPASAQAGTRPPASTQAPVRASPAWTPTAAAAATHAARHAQAPPRAGCSQCTRGR